MMKATQVPGNGFGYAVSSMVHNYLHEEADVLTNIAYTVDRLHNTTAGYCPLVSCLRMLPADSLKQFCCLMHDNLMQLLGIPTETFLFECLAVDSYRYVTPTQGTDQQVITEWYKHVKDMPELLDEDVKACWDAEQQTLNLTAKVARGYGLSIAVRRSPLPLLNEPTPGMIESVYCHTIIATPFDLFPKVAEQPEKDAVNDQASQHDDLPNSATRWCDQ